MFGRPVSLFKIFGFEIKVDISWLILAALVTWSLASGLFPEYYKDLPRAYYWWMGAAGAAGLFLSIVFHELAHSLVARNYGISMKGITLFIFGGVAEMEDDPPNPRAEFFMAIVGPLSSAAISLFLFLIIFWGKDRSWPVTINGVLAYLAWLNIVLAVFNLVPAFPLDGGRVLRSALWSWKKNLRWATAICRESGIRFRNCINNSRSNFLIHGQFCRWSVVVYDWIIHPFCRAKILSATFSARSFSRKKSKRPDGKESSDGAAFYITYGIRQ